MVVNKKRSSDVRKLVTLGVIAMLTLSACSGITQISAQAPKSCNDSGSFYGAVERIAEEVSVSKNFLVEFAWQNVKTGNSPQYRVGVEVFALKPQYVDFSQEKWQLTNLRSFGDDYRLDLAKVPTFYNQPDAFCYALEALKKRFALNEIPSGQSTHMNMRTLFEGAVRASRAVHVTYTYEGALNDWFSVQIQRPQVLSYGSSVPGAGDYIVSFMSISPSGLPGDMWIVSDWGVKGENADLNEAMHQAVERFGLQYPNVWGK